MKWGNWREDLAVSLITLFVIAAAGGIAVGFRALSEPKADDRTFVVERYSENCKRLSANLVLGHMRERLLAAGKAESGPAGWKAFTLELLNDMDEETRRRNEECETAVREMLGRGR